MILGSRVPYLNTFLVPVPFRNHYEIKVYTLFPGYFKVQNKEAKSLTCRRGSEVSQGSSLQPIMLGRSASIVGTGRCDCPDGIDRCSVQVATEMMGVSCHLAHAWENRKNMSSRNGRNPINAADVNGRQA